MPTITLIEFNGTSHAIEAETASPDAECHRQRRAGYRCRLAAPVLAAPATVLSSCLAAGHRQRGRDEEAMGMRPDRTELSRLSCQISVSDELTAWWCTCPSTRCREVPQGHHRLANQRSNGMNQAVGLPDVNNAVGSRSMSMTRACWSRMPGVPTSRG